MRRAVHYARDGSLALHAEQLRIGARLTVLSREMRLTGFADEPTRRRYDPIKDIEDQLNKARPAANPRPALCGACS